MQRPCKCSGGLCYKQFAQGEVLDFLNEFQKLSKQEQDSVLYLACQNSGTNQRREYFFLSKPIGRSCMEQLLGISSHRTDRTGQVDLRFGPRANMRPSELSASVDSFCAILYNSVAEPLPDRPLILPGQSFCFVHPNHPPKAFAGSFPSTVKSNHRN